MARKSKQVSRKRKAQMPEEDDKANESILEEVLSISGKNVEKSDCTSAKNVEKSDAPPPAKLKRTANKSNDVTTCSPKKSNAKKGPATPPTSPSKQKKSKKEESAKAAVNAVKAKTVLRGDPVPTLPDGWRRQVVKRKSGRSAGQLDIYFYSPDGTKLRSRPDVGTYLQKHKYNLKVEDFDFSRAAKLQGFKDKDEDSAENSTVRKKKTKTVQAEKSKVGVEAKDSSKNVSTKVAAEVSPTTDDEEKNDAVGKANKVLTEEKNTIEMNGKQKEKTLPTKKRKSQIPEEGEEQNEAISEDVSSKKEEKADGSSNARLKRSASKSNETISTPPKKLNAKQKDSTDEEVEDNSVNNELKVSEKGDPVPNFPDGWKRQVVARKSGEKSGRMDIYFYSPEGIKLRSRPDVATYLKKHKCDLKIEDFDFSQSGKTTEVDPKNKPAENSTVPKKRNKTVQDEKSKVGEESKELTEKVCAEAPLDDSEEKEEEGDGKPNQMLRLILESKSSRKTRR